MNDMRRAEEALRNAHQAGDVEAAKKLAAYIRTQQPEPSFAGGIEESVEKRVQNLGDIQQQYTSGEIDPALTFYKVGREGFGTMADIGAEALKSAGRGISAITPDVVKEPVVSGMKKVGEYISNSPVGEAAQYAGEKYGEFKKANPYASQYAEAMGGTLADLPMAIGTKTAATKGLGAAERKLNVKTVYPNAQEIADKSTQLYAEGRELGADFSPKVLDDLYRAGYEEMPKSKISSQIIKSDAADELTQKVGEFLGQKPTLDDFTELDTYLGDKAASAYVSDRALSRKYSKMQNALRDAVENPENIEGSAEGIKAHREATRLWGIKKKVDEIDRAIRIGMDYDVPATGIRKQFQRIKNNDKLFKSYSKSEKKAIELAARTGEVEGIVRALGSRLNVIGGLVAGGPAGALGMSAVSTAGRKGAEMYRVGKGVKVLEELGKRSGMVRKEKRISPEKMREILKMKPKDAKKALEEIK